MKIHVEIAFSFKRDMDPDDLALDLPSGSTVRDALFRLAAQSDPFRHRVFDEAGVIARHIQALVNGVNVQHARGFDTVLNDGDRLTVLPRVGGG